MKNAARALGPPVSLFSAYGVNTERLVLDMSEHAFVYILASPGRRLHVGITTDLEQQVWDHKNKLHPATARAPEDFDRLVYYERFGSLEFAARRCRQINRWLRRGKLALVASANPAWRDLSFGWGRPLGLPAEPRHVLRPHLTTGFAEIRKGLTSPAQSEQFGYAHV